VPSFDRIRNRLPSLYHPEDDSTLLSAWLRAIGTVLDAIHRESTQVMQSHWFPYADQAMYNPWFLLTRELSKPPKPFPKPDDPELKQFPYIDDLARLGALIPIAPWEQPPQLRDLVEDYRLRIARLVAVYRNGLGTMQTLRLMVEAQLPANHTKQGAPPDRPFWLEEFAPSNKQTYPAPTRGEPVELVGPLMRWTVDGGSLNSAAPTVYIQGVTPQADKVDATVNPMVEFYQAGSEKPRVGLAYADTLAPGQTVRLTPSASSWLGLNSGVQTARSSTDPTAPGPWQAVAGGPADPVDAIYQTQDRTLWAAVNSGGDSVLARFDGTTWSNAVTGLAAIHALGEEGANLLVASDGGLLRVQLYPSGPFASTPDPGFTGRQVFATFRASDGRLWCGTDAGAFVEDSGGTVQPSPFQAVAVSAITQDIAGVFYFGTALGLFQWQPASDSWNWYEGKNFGEENADWQAFFPDKSGADQNFPAAGQPFLPQVTCVLSGSDSSVWLGTANGIARYYAPVDQSLEAETILEAFPDLTTGPVFSIQQDERGLLWFATDRGLFRYDGRDWWQAQSDAWVQLGRADTVLPAGIPRGQWRFDRASGKWQRLNGTWISFDGAPVSTAEPAVHAIFWTDGVTADLGQWDGATFSNATPVASEKLLVRVKPTEETIVNGGIPALPRLPRGASVWRYLSMEPPSLVAPGPVPWWSTEGRLFPPPADIGAPGEGRYDVTTPPPESDFDSAVFSYNPAARVWFEWLPQQPLSVLVRLKKVTPDETIDPAIIDRVWQGIQQVRPAGVKVRLAVEEDIVKS